MSNWAQDAVVVLITAVVTLIALNRVPVVGRLVTVGAVLGLAIGLSIAVLAH